MKLFQRFNPSVGFSVSDTSSSTAAVQLTNDVEVVPAGPAPQVKENKTISRRVAFGAGCFWGVEKYVVRDFQKRFPGSIDVDKTKVGFMSPFQRPRIEKPTYRQVCTGTSGHVEVLYVELNDPEKHFEELCRFFFMFHDPTIKDRQGNDIGFQYSSWIFTDGPEQFRIAQKVRDELQAAMNTKAIPQGTYQNRTIETRLANLSEFTEAGPEHQEYLARNPTGYCNHRIRLKKWYTIKQIN